MKTFFSYTKAAVATLTMGVILGGCAELLDTAPSNSTDLVQTYRTAAGIRGNALGLYTGLYSLGTYSNDFVMVPDLLAADSILTFNGTFSAYGEFRRAAISIENGQVQRIYSNAYTIIMRANLLLANLDYADPTERDLIEAEARFFRGTMYFNLARFFGRQYDANANDNPAVPIYTDPIPVDNPFEIPAEYQKGRSSVRAVYDRAIIDLTAAYNTLPDRNSLEPVAKYRVTSRANNAMAAAMLAKLYLQKGVMDSAYYWSDIVINHPNSYGLLADPRLVWREEASSEAIWELQQNLVNGAVSVNGGLPAHYGKRNPGRGDIWFRVSGSGLTQFNLNTAVWNDANDLRIPNSTTGMGVTGADANNTTRTFTYKWAGGPTDNWLSQRKAMIILRLAEQYLIRAEAGFISGQGNPLQDINDLRAARGASALGSVTQEVIYQERIRELYAEGHLLWDKKRLGKNIAIWGNATSSATAPTIVAATADRFVLPIPQRARQTNPNLSQNTGY